MYLTFVPMRKHIHPMNMEKKCLAQSLAPCSNPCCQSLASYAPISLGIATILPKEMDRLRFKLILLQRKT